jgi:uncharacterized membrane protein YfcA
VVVFPFLGAFLIGLSKAGFAAGLGMLTTPLVAMTVPAKAAIGLVLPLLCAADALTLGVFWRKWDAAMVRAPLVGALAGIAGGMLFVSRVSNRALALAIGIVGLTMVLLLAIRARWYPHAVYRPRTIDAVLVGIAAGFSSAVAHAAGPIFALFLLAQRMPKEAFVATNAVFFTVVNLLKVPPYVLSGLITMETLGQDLRLLPMIPLGVFAGWATNKLLPQQHFDIVVQVLLGITSLHLLVASWP